MYERDVEEERRKAFSVRMRGNIGDFQYYGGDSCHLPEPEQTHLKVV